MEYKNLVRGKKIQTVLQNQAFTTKRLNVFFFIDNRLQWYEGPLESGAGESAAEKIEYSPASPQISVGIHHNIRLHHNNSQSSIYNKKSTEGGDIEKSVRNVLKYQTETEG